MHSGNIAKLLALIRQYGLDNIDEVRWWLSLIELGEMDEGLAEMCLYQCQAYAEERRQRPNFLAPPPTYEELYPEGEDPPDLILGHLVDRPEVPIGISLRGAVHGVLAGTTEGGKSVTLRRLMVAAAERNRSHPNDPVSIIMLDRAPDCLNPKLLLGDDCLHFDAHSTLRLSAKTPIGVSPDHWINHYAETFCARAGLKAARIPLANLMRGLVAAMNPAGAAKPVFPPFRLMLEVLRRLPKRSFADKDPYVDSLTTWLMDVTHGTGKLFESCYGLDLEEDVIAQGKSAVISMPQMSPAWISHFVPDIFVLELLLGRSMRGQQRDSANVLLLIDEADEDVSWANERFFEPSLYPISKGMRQLRKFGVGIFVAVGALNPVSRHVLNAARYKLIFALSDAKCVDMAAQTLLLPPGGAAMLQHLTPGQCLFRSPRWPHAMHVQIHYVPPDRDVVPVFDANPHVPAKRLEDLPGILEALRGTTRQHRQDEAQRTAAEMQGLSAEARNLLIQASTHPYWPVQRLFELGQVPTPQAQIAIRKEIEDRKLADFKQVRPGSRNLLLKMLTAEAWALLGKPPIEIGGRGGIAHMHYSAWIRMVGERRKYSRSVVEWLIPGTNHPADAAWLVDGRWEVFEVVVDCSENLVAHLEAALLHSSEPIARVTVVAPQKKDLDDLRRRVESAPSLAPVLEKIAYEVALVYMKELWP
jgi:hypothetical protein